MIYNFTFLWYSISQKLLTTCLQYCNLVNKLDKYIKKYKGCCDNLKIDTKILLIESPYEYIKVNKEIEINEVLGYDCLGTINYSYLYTDFKDYEKKLKSKNVKLNKVGLFNKYEDVLNFIELRRKDIDSGLNIENYWKEIPIKISIVNS